MNYQELVLQVYSDAYADIHYNGIWIEDSKLGTLSFRQQTEENAWENAYNEMQNDMIYRLSL
jgi:hypothetical protein